MDRFHTREFGFFTNDLLVDVGHDGLAKAEGKRVVDKFKVETAA